MLIYLFSLHSLNRESDPLDCHVSVEDIVAAEE